MYSLGIILGSSSHKAGGLFTSVRRSAQALADLGVDITVYALDDAPNAADVAAWKPLEPRLFPSLGPQKLGISPHMRAALAKANHDVLHQHGIWQYFSKYTSEYTRRTGSPTMISPRGMLDSWALGNSGYRKRIAGRLFEDNNLAAARCIHALNTSEAQAISSHLGKTTIAVIPNGTDVLIAGPADRTAIAGKRRKNLLFLGRLHPKKGLSELIEAWAKLNRNGADQTADWHLTIAGWGEQEFVDHLGRCIAQTNLSNITLRGPAFADEKAALFSASDGFILPSHSEGLPMAVLEAWSAGLPVLMTRHCNIPEGFSAQAAIEIPTDPAQMVTALRQALVRTDLNQIGANGLDLVKNRFAWEKIAKEHDAVYRWMLSGGPAPQSIWSDPPAA